MCPPIFDSAKRAAAFRQGIMTNLLESESRAFLPRLSAAVHRSDRADEDPRFHYARSDVCHDRNHLVFDSRLVRLRFQRPIARAARPVANVLNRAVGSLFVFLGLRLASARR